MAALTTQAVPSTGLSATANAAAGGGDTFPFGSIIRVFNGGGAPITVTMVTPGVVDGDLAVANRDVTVTNATAKFIRPTVDYRDPDTGLVSLTYSGVTSVTVEVITA